MNIDHLIRTEIFLANVEAILKLDIDSELKVKMILDKVKEYEKENR